MPGHSCRVQGFSTHFNAMIHFPKILFCLTLLLSRPGFASEVRDYYSLINEAELLICENQLQKALVHYDKAFAIPEIQPWGKDVYNAWISAYITDDSSRFRRYSTILVSRGAFAHEHVHENLLNKVPIGPGVARYSTIWQQVKQTVPSILDTTYRQQVEELVTKDQEVRRYFVKQFGGNYNIGGRDSLNPFDSLNVLRFSVLVKQKGFPSETRIGYNGHYPTNLASYCIILIHDRSWTDRHTLDTMLYSELLKGTVPPQLYAMIKGDSYMAFEDSVAGYQRNPYAWYGTNTFAIVDDSLFVSKFSYVDTGKINRARRDIYLDPLPDMYAKALFQYQHDYFEFITTHYFASIPGLPDEIKQKIKRVISYQNPQSSDFNPIRKQRCQYGLRH